MEKEEEAAVSFSLPKIKIILLKQLLSMNTESCLKSLKTIRSINTCNKIQ